MKILSENTERAVLELDRLDLLRKDQQISTLTHLHSDKSRQIKQTYQYIV